MPARDHFHQAVKTALENDGWKITADPLYLGFGGVDLYVDLAADKMIAAEKQGRKIAIEIKGFTAPSITSEFHLALGQFINYRTALAAEEPERHLFLAVPEDIYNTFFNLPLPQLVVEQQALRLLVYSIEKEAIILWYE